MEEGQRGVVLPWDDKWQVPITQKADTVVIFIFAIQYEFDVEFLFWVPDVENGRVFSWFEGNTSSQDSIVSY